MSQVESQPSQSVAAWWLILCLVGLDYFSTLAYLPSMAIQAVGAAAPIAALIVALVTLCIALPVYYYVVARSPRGTGATRLLERLVPGWRVKLLILLLLSFVATDYVVTQNLSIADAAEHLRSNPQFHGFAQPLLNRQFRPEQWFDHPWWQRVAGRLDTQLLLTLVLLCASFALWAYWRAGSARRFLHTAAVVVVGYMALNAIVIASGLPSDEESSPSTTGDASGALGGAGDEVGGGSGGDSVGGWGFVGLSSLGELMEWISQEPYAARAGVRALSPIADADRPLAQRRAQLRWNRSWHIIARGLRTSCRRLRG